MIYLTLKKKYMHKNNLKNIIQYINKYAVAFGDTDSSDEPVYVAPTNDISNMQRSIQEFANAAVNYKSKATGREPSGKPIYTVSKEDKRRDFNDFLAEQFMATADVHGEEYSTDIKATAKESKLPTDIVQLDNIIDGLRRIGASKSEMQIDGVWDFRTNNAVKNTYAFAAAIVTAYEALGGMAPNDPSIFTRTDLEQFKNAIPKEKDPKAAKIDDKILNQYASQLIPLIKKLTEFYKKFSNNTMDHAAYRQYINQSSPLYVFSPGGSNPYKPDPNDLDQKKFMDNPKTFILPKLTLIGKSGRQFNLDNKINLETFQSTGGLANLMVQHLGYSNNEVNNPKLLIQIVRSILHQVSSYIDTNSKLLPPRPPPPPKPIIYTYNPKLAPPT